VVLKYATFPKKQSLGPDIGKVLIYGKRCLFVAMSHISSTSIYKKAELS